MPNQWRIEDPPQGIILSRVVSSPLGIIRNKNGGKIQFCAMAHDICVII